MSYKDSPWARTLIAFDVDGIFKQDSKESDYVKGPIDPVEVLLKFHDKHFNLCCIVSPSPYYPKNKDGSSMFPIYAKEASVTMRHKNLLDAVEDTLVKPDIKLYISDNGDHKEAKKAGFIYVDVNDFKNMLSEHPSYPSNMGDLVEETFDDIKAEEEQESKYYDKI